MEGFWRDIRYGIRELTRTRGFTIAALLSLSAGIGLNTAVFSFTDAVLLRPFPYKDPGRLVLIWGTKSIDVRRGMNGESVEDWRKQSQTLADIAVFQMNPYPFSVGNDSTQNVQGALVGTNAFSVLETHPLLGRTFSDLENHPGGDKRVILSYGFWRSHFAENTDVVGKMIQLNGEIYDILGVMPQGFFFPDQDIQLWVPLTRASPVFGQVHGLARLEPGVTIRQAQTELDTLSARSRLRSNNPIRTEPGVFSLYRVVVGKYQLALWVLFGAVALLLLLACANVSNMWLARTVEKEKDFAVRVTFGASRLRIFRLSLAEDVIVSVVAGVLGVLCADCLLVFLRSLNLTQIPHFQSAHIDFRVLLFASGISLLTAVFAGIVPAWKSAHPNINAALQLGGVSTHPRSHSQARDFLVTIEVALALVLLVGTGLLVNSFVRLTHADWGFNPDHLLIVEDQFPADAKKARCEELVADISERLSKIPFVRSSAVAYGVPIRYSWHPTHLSVDGRIVTSDWEAGAWTIGPDYFKTMGVPILGGREFSGRDIQSDLRSVVVSRDLAERLWPGKNPIGRQIQIMRLNKDIEDRMRRNHTAFLDQETWRSAKSWEADGSPSEVIGEVGNVRAFGLDSATADNPALYIDYAHASGRAPVYRFVIRTSVDSPNIVSVLKDGIMASAPESRITEIDAMSSLVSRSIGGRGSNRLLLVISVLFGTLSLLLATVGIYGVVSFTAAQRTREIGIRRSLGSQSGDIFKMVLAQGMRPVFEGLALGLVGAFGLTRLLKGILFGITATDPMTFVAISILLVIAALAACIVPALRAVRISPIETLRYE